MNCWNEQPDFTVILVWQGRKIKYAHTCAMFHPMNTVNPLILMFHMSNLMFGQGLRFGQHEPWPNLNGHQCICQTHTQTKQVESCYSGENVSPFLLEKCSSCHSPLFAGN